jgi:hypothetical protein
MALIGRDARCQVCEERLEDGRAWRGFPLFVGIREA